MTQTVGPTAALAGVPAGVQAQGVWQGRRQLFIRFAAEAETATMYTAAALAGELRRSAERSAFHSISISGRDPLSNTDYLAAALADRPAALPVMLDVDGQRPDAVATLHKVVSLVQVTLEGAMSGDAVLERALETLTEAGKSKLLSGLVLGLNDQSSDAQVMRVVQQAHEACHDTAIVIHPPASAPLDRDRRWITLMERATSVHGDVRLSLRLPPPTGMR